MRSDVRYKQGDFILKRYLVEQMRRGGMGIIYLCVDQLTQMPVAIKTFEDRYLDSERNRKKFLEEACTWIELGSHPNIVRAYSVFLIDEKPYLLLERVAAQDFRGSTLKDYIFSNLINEKDILQIGIHICDGMLYALRKIPGFVHRDLKTENILITQEGLPKIADFGLTLHEESIQTDLIEKNNVAINIAKQSRDAQLDLARLVKQLEGAPAYVSPEQCLGKPLDTRTDIYSFGCLLYAIVTKNPPFVRVSVEETLLAHLSDKPIEPIRINPAIQPSLSKLIMECLVKEPYQRISSFAIARNRLIGIYLDAYGGRPLTYTQGDPLSAQDYLEQGESFEALGEWKRAERALTAAIEVRSDWAKPYIAMARVFFEQGDVISAMERLELAHFYEPEHPDIYEIKAHILTRQNFLEQAKTCYERAIELNPNNTALYIRLADIHVRNSCFDEAESILRRGMRRGGDPMPFYRALAHLYRKIGGKQNELDAVTLMLKDRPDDADLLLRAAELSYYLRDTPMFRKWTNRALAVNPQEAEALYRLGCLLLKMDKRSVAYEVFKRACRLGYQNGELFLELAKMEMDRRDHHSAWNMLLQAEDHGLTSEPLKRSIQAKRFRDSMGKR